MKARVSKIVFLILLVWNGQLAGQNDDSPVEAAEDFIVLNAVELTDTEVLSMTERLQELANDPVDLNSERVNELADAGLITAFQLNKLKEYRYRYGKIISLNEVYAVEGWDSSACNQVWPFITINPDRVIISGKTSLRSHARQVLLLSVGRVVERSTGYLESGDEDGKMPPSYAGSPWKYSLRYDLLMGNRIIAGIRAEKDPGEEFINLHHDYGLKTHYTDHLSGFAVIQAGKVVRKIYLGDYHVRFGRGLTLSTSGGYSSWKDPFSRSGTNNVLRQNTSMVETSYLRGLAVELGLSRLSCQFFFSIRSLDPSGASLDSSKILSFTSVSQTGLHRTAQELARRGLLEEILYGAVLSYHNSWLKAGLCYYRTEFSAAMIQIDRPDTKYSPSGAKQQSIGAYTEAYLGKTIAFAEISLSEDLVAAFSAGLVSHLYPFLDFSLEFRHLPVQFGQPIHSIGCGPYGSSNNETGISMGTRIGLPEHWNISLITDFAYKPWIDYGTDFSNIKQAFHVRLTKTDYSNSFLLAYTFKQGGQNATSTYQYLPEMLYLPRHQAELQFVLSHGPLKYKSRLTLILTKEETNEFSMGSSMQQEISFYPWQNILKITLGTVLFKTDNYESRIYLYEPDVLYTSGNQMLYGRGIRTYLMIRLSASEIVDFRMKAGISIYEDSYSIGSGLDEIYGNKKTTVGVQLRLKI